METAAEDSEVVAVIAAVVVEADMEAEEVALVTVRRMELLLAREAAMAVATAATEVEVEEAVMMTVVLGTLTMSRSLREAVGTATATAAATPDRRDRMMVGMRSRGAGEDTKTVLEAPDTAQW